VTFWSGEKLIRLKFTAALVQLNAHNAPLHIM
jgi:hypothetical protein